MLWLAFIHECMHIKNNDFDRFKSFSILEKETNEEFIDSETLCFLFSGHTDQMNELNENNISDISYDTQIPIGILAEIARTKLKEYQSYSFNKYLHYFKDYEIDRLF